MRVSLTLKPNSRPDFGFQAHWDPTGVRVKFIQPGKHQDTFNFWVSEFLTQQHCVFLARLTELKMCKKMWPFSCFIVRRVDDKWQERQSYAELTIVFFLLPSAFPSQENCSYISLVHEGVFQDTERSQHWWRQTNCHDRKEQKKKGITETVQRVQTKRRLV